MDFSNVFSVFSEKLTAQVHCPSLRSALERPEIVKEKYMQGIIGRQSSRPFSTQTL
jgi:hypothetical protein